MTETLLSIPPHLRKRLAKALESGLLDLHCSTSALRSIVGLTEGGEKTIRALKELKDLGLSANAAAVWIRSIEEADQNVTRPDLVWSGPEVPGVHARGTRQVYDELLGSVERSAWVSTYAYFDGPRAFETLARRMDEKQELQVTLLLNIQRKPNDTTDASYLIRGFADRFWGTDWPGSSRPAVYYDPRPLDQDKPGGVLHAKSVVVDMEKVFITSANLTEAALDRNIELGLLLQDKALAVSIISHLRGLIERGLLKPLPPK